MIELVKFAKGRSAYYFGLIALSPWMIAMKAGLITNQQGKEKLLAHFFGGTTIDNFNQLCQQFTEKKLPQLIRADAMKAIKDHLGNGDLIVVVTASAENWVKPWCALHGIKTLCSKLHVKDGVVTGFLDGSNCNGAEKVSRIVSEYNPADFEKIYAYGDSRGDDQMLALATNPFFRVFKS
jgi:HAD superfamily hydrolase (TIGR01490 family)